jgi:DHA2 family multidrug resistance protein
MTPATKAKAAESVTASTWAGFAMMCVGMFMAILDVQVVATSLATIQRALNIPQDQMSWVQTAYLIAEIIAIPLTGFLTRVLTMRWLFVIAVSVFTLASIACAASGGFATLIVSRIVQGFFGGMLIPTVFAAIFLLFPFRNQALATTIAGVLAVLAPTVGPVVGGWITETYSWPWLFLINVLPGVMTAIVASLLLPKEQPALDVARHLDWISLSLLALSLAALQVAIKEAPERGWTSSLIAALLVVSFVSGAGFVTKALGTTQPLVDLRVFKNRNFTAGCVLSFIVGMGLFGSIYLMPLFLAYVRGHGSLEIGKIILVTGIAQLAAAPLAVVLDQRYDERALTAIGFLMLGIGLGLSGVQTTSTDYDEMFWPQVVRGCATMLCILPSTRLALGLIAKANIPDASGLFNLMRNLGGAIGIAIIDTVIYSRAPVYSRNMIDRLSAGDTDLAKTLGIPLDVLAGLALAPDNSVVAELVSKAALVQAINNAWAFLAVSVLAAIVIVPLARTTSQPSVIVTIRKGRVIVRRARTDVR